MCTRRPKRHAELTSCWGTAQDHSPEEGGVQVLLSILVTLYTGTQQHRGLFCVRHSITSIITNAFSSELRRPQHRARTRGRLALWTSCWSEVLLVTCRFWARGPCACNTGGGAEGMLVLLCLTLSKDRGFLHMPPFPPSSQVTFRAIIIFYHVLSWNSQHLPLSCDNLCEPTVASEHSVSACALQYLMHSSFLVSHRSSRSGGHPFFGKGNT